MLNGSNMHFKLRRARPAEGRVTLRERWMREVKRKSISMLIYSGTDHSMLNITDELYGNYYDV